MNSNLNNNNNILKCRVSIYLRFNKSRFRYTFSWYLQNYTTIVTYSVHSPEPVESVVEWPSHG